MRDKHYKIRLTLAISMMVWVHTFLYWVCYEAVHGPNTWALPHMGILSWLSYISSLSVLIAWAILIVPLVDNTNTEK